MSSRRRKQSGPMTAAGLISFYDEYEGKIKMSPMTLVIVASVYALIVVIAHILF
ncbi:MAG: preprotein translocase subunit Sec61beta [Desulfurococcales archaeon]|nr:preprotein translocase subunit Sec61beta [Desulfurococcales archaeon]